MNERKHIIWSNENLDYEDWRETLEENYPDVSEESRIELMYEINDENLLDERCTLSIRFNEPILVIADIGRWNGRFSGYQEIESGNIADCLYTDMDYATWYVDKNGDFRCDAIHHDGTNHYLYRVYKENTTEFQRDTLKEKIYEGKATRNDITRTTRKLGDEIAKVYGFDIPKQNKKKDYER